MLEFGIVACLCVVAIFTHRNNTHKIKTVNKKYKKDRLRRNKWN